MVWMALLVSVNQIRLHFGSGSFVVDDGLDGFVGIGKPDTIAFWFCAPTVVWEDASVEDDGASGDSVEEGDKVEVVASEDTCVEEVSIGSCVSTMSGSSSVCGLFWASDTSGVSDDSGVSEDSSGVSDIFCPLSVTVGVLEDTVASEVLSGFS